MTDKLYATINKYEIHTVLSDEYDVFLKKESFQIALKRLVDSLNKYTKGHVKKIVHSLLENEASEIASNQYVYFDVSGATVGENNLHIYVMRFTWEPFRCITINELRNAPISSIGSFTGCVRWENDDFHTMFPAEFDDNITYSRWKESNRIFHKGSYFYDLSEYLFHVFTYNFYKYTDALAYLGYNQKEDITTGTQQIVAVFSNAANLLSKYPKGIDYNDSKQCLASDWFYHTLESVFNELDKKNDFDSTDFYLAMCNYVKELGESKYKDKITINAD